MIFFAGRPYAEGYMPNVNIVVGPVLMSTLDEEFEANMRGLKPNVENYQQFEQIKTVVGGREAIIIDHEYNFPDESLWRMLQMSVVEDDLAWNIACGAFPEIFSDNQEIINQVVRSFRILK